ncbi:Cytochrome P450 [Macrophomina phaseolina MS6]|uniref:Cytochrome P450 n=1 Tax=Macrophomina phaseolina (strain MS6) TaxID=1126212 RepID=K2RZY7_MACPH|nr:Cytochrome P450 [Macrophomina phaseolina MS6]
MIVMPYSDAWRAQGKVTHAIPNGSQPETKFQPYQDVESKQLLYEYLHAPDKWHVANARYSDSVIMSVVFGRRAKMEDPELYELCEVAKVLGSNLAPGASLADMSAWLAYLPKFLQWWRPYRRKWYLMTLKYAPQPPKRTRLYFMADKFSAKGIQARTRPHPREDGQRRGAPLLRRRPGADDGQAPARRDVQGLRVRRPRGGRLRHLAHRDWSVPHRRRAGPARRGEGGWVPR